MIDTDREDCEFNWELCEQRLIGLGNRDIYVVGGIIPEAMKIVRQGAIFDTRPLRELLERLVNGQMKFYSLGDLPIKTYISVSPFRARGSRCSASMVVLESTVFR